MPEREIIHVRPAGTLCEGHGRRIQVAVASDDEQCLGTMGGGRIQGAEQLLLQPGSRGSIEEEDETGEAEAYEA